VAPVLRVPSIGGTTQGANDVRVVGAGAQLGDDVGSSLRDLVMTGIDVGVPGSVVPGDVAPALVHQVPCVRGILTLLARLSRLSMPTN
jgi:hypothetical protein